MAYFNEFPYIRYEFPDDIRLIKNLSIRPAVVDEFFGERSNFETYTIRDGDTPETIAYDLFGDPQLHWTIMLPNNVLNLYEDWPKTTAQFDLYLLSKYRASDSDTLDEIREFIEFTGSVTNNFQTTIGDSDSVRSRIARPHHFEDANGVIYPYDSIIGNVGRLDAWGRLMVLPKVTPISIFEYESRLNEGKRDIVVPKFGVAQRMKAQLRDLVNA